MRFKPMEWNLRDVISGVKTCMRTLLIGFFLSSGMAGTLWAQSAELAELRGNWEKQVKKVEIASLFAGEKLAPAYKRMVESEMEKAQRAGKLEVLIELKDEVARVAEELTRAEPPSKIPEVLRVQQMLAEQLDKIDAQRNKETLKFSRVYRKQLNDLQLALTKQGDIEGALAAKQEHGKLLLRPEYRFLPRLAVRGTNPHQWQVVFRGKDPADLGSGKSDDLTHAIAFDNVPEDMTFMRLSNLETQDFVVLKMTREDLVEGMTEGNYQWRFGTNEHWATLAVIDFTDRLEPRTPDAFFWSTKGQKYAGWGYGPRIAYPDPEAADQEEEKKQGLRWGDETLTRRALLEVAVTSEPLGEADQAKLLINPERKPKKPAVDVTSNLPERLPRSLLLTADKAALTGAAKKVDGGVRLGNGVDKGRASWDLSKIRQGSYDVHVTYSSNSGGLMSVQGARPTMASRTKILLERVNIITRKTRDDRFRREVFVRLKLGGFNNLEVILSPRTGYDDDVTIHRIEVTAPAK